MTTQPAADDPNARTFPLAAILTVTTGRYFPGPSSDGTDHIGSLYALLTFLARRPVFTHELPDLADQFKPELLRQHPELAQLRVPTTDEASALDRQTLLLWYGTQVAHFGQTLAVRRPSFRGTANLGGLTATAKGARTVQGRGHATLA